MRLCDRYDGGGDPFEGDRTLLLRALPVGARVRRAQAIVTPFDGTQGANPFAEAIDFTRATGSFGATKSAAGGQWVEVDFHARRTLAGVAGVDLENTTLQVDLGGAYVEINVNGGVKTPNDGGPLTLFSSDEPLPGLTVTKLKLTNLIHSPPSAARPDISRVLVRSAPTNPSLRLGELPPFWLYVGEMTEPQTTADFAAALNAALATAQTEAGFYLLDFVLHSDAIARLVVALDIEYTFEQSVLPDGLEEVVLPFDLSGEVPGEGGRELSLAVPSGARVAAAGATVQVKGVFDETRLVLETDVDAPIVGEVSVSPQFSQAQPIKLAAEALATDVDLFVKLTSTVRLQLDLHTDLDGKPAQTSLLPAPVEFELPGPAGVDEKIEKVRPRWVGVRLPAEFKFKAETVYWLTLQSVEGEVAWQVLAAPDEASLTVQRTDDGGLSWRAAEVEQRQPGPLRTFFRLRRRPSRFEMPFALMVGTGAEAVAVDLSRFESLGRVDFALEAGDLAGAVNEYLQTTGPRTCPEVDHLSNGDFKQWLKVGDTLGKPAVIPLDAPPYSIGFAPDGAWAYVGLRVGEETGVLRVFDVACNVPRAADVRLEIVPFRILMSPDGMHAFVAGGGRLQLIDTTTHRTIGPAFAPGAGIARQHGELIEALALNAAGSRLYVVERYTQSEDTQPGTRRQLHVLDTEKLAQVLAGGQANLADVRLLTAPLERVPIVQAIAVTPDETRLYALCFSPGEPGEGSFRVLDLSDLSLEGVNVALGPRPNALAVSPDGTLALVTDETSRQLTFIDIGSGARAETFAVTGTLAIAPTPRGVVITSDGQRAYVIGDRELRYIDLKRRTSPDPLPLGQFAISLAVTPQGDRIYVGNAPHITGGPQTGEEAIYSIQVGARQPFEWNVTSGRVNPVCLPKPFRQVALLGSPQSQLASAAPNDAQEQPTSISQVVPVLEKCVYDFSFYAIAGETGAVAELFWLDSGCSPLSPDPFTVQIEALRLPNLQISTAAKAARASRIIAESAPLALHREQLRAPAGATQAEVRFTIPPGVVGAVEAVSLVGTNEVLENADFTQQIDGRLRGWQLTSPTEVGFTLGETAAGMRLRNVGTNTVELSQAVLTQGATLFTLELQGLTETRVPDQAHARVEIQWLDVDGKAVDQPAGVELRPAGFGVSAVSGKVPAGAAGAALRLLVPPGVTQFVKRLSLRFPRENSVPLIFYAQAPGELTLRDWRVTYEGAPVVAPALPAGGLCPTTPPGRQPGGPAAQNGTHFCQSCANEQAVVGSTSMQTASGRPATASRCATCGSDVVHFGVRAAAVAPSVAPPPLVTRALLNVASLRTNAALSANVSPLAAAAAAQPFTSIKGIGAVRTQSLKAVGIDSVEVLAAANPEDVAQVKGIPLPLAHDFINQARALLTFNHT